MNKPISISLPEDMITEIDQICVSLGKDRSEYVRDCIRRNIEVQKTLQDPDGSLKDRLYRYLMADVVFR